MSLSPEVIRSNYILTRDLLVFVTYPILFCTMEEKLNFQQPVCNHVGPTRL